MSYLASVALQGAVYQCLRDDPELNALVGDAVFDAMPIDAPSGVYVSLGPEEVTDQSDSGGRAARHDFVVSVLAGTEEAAGFRAVKEAAVAVSAALEGADLVTEAGRLAGLWFLRARAKRVKNGAERRVDLTFRALIDMA
ncbi:DUF3168 domain-containing protein [Paracoccus aurantiacus]|uniref:DUF3168 domain-containing protein n=1 Tax=Paracoccus aurantiacus TaxID=2599412 RepID=A0A5C6S8X7_9RHOB|nr:DUF3168 domain-containing protein [Paracoccus aurantiacus]TXB70906.1 DUF3168 domain-containing protein [Paracoccus aurantiacus]